MDPQESLHGAGRGLTGQTGREYGQSHASTSGNTPVLPLSPSSVQAGGSTSSSNHLQGVGNPTGPLPAIPTDPSAKEQQAAAKQSLKQWWTKFTKQQQQQQAGLGASGKKDDTSPTSSGKGVFGVPLTDSLKYAGVAISMVGPDGVNQVYGYIPIVVAKCGLFLKQKATTVEGVFRISGSTRRMKELQDIFDRPPSYGRDVVWGPWSVHDAASVLRRYLNQMPEPVVPYELYNEFRNALPPIDKVDDPAAVNASIQRYKALIACLPTSSKYLLCYVLDLLNVFSRHHAQNLMPAANLAVVFQPGLIRPADTALLPKPVPENFQPSKDSHTETLNPPSFPQLSRTASNPATSTAMAASSTSDSRANMNELQRRQDEIKINQEVLEFLINHQDSFVVLPEPFSSTEVSPITPTSGSSRGQPSLKGEKPVSAGQKGTQNTSRPSRPSTTTRNTEAAHVQQPAQKSAAVQSPPQSQAPFSAPPPLHTRELSQSQPHLQPPVHSQSQYYSQLPLQSTSQIQAPSSQPTSQTQTQPQAPPQLQARSHARPPLLETQQQPSAHSQPSQQSRTSQLPRQEPKASVSLPFQGQEAAITSGRASPVQREYKDNPIQRDHRDYLKPSENPTLPERTSPVMAMNQQQPQSSKGHKAKDDSISKEERKPRKLKKGRTPTSSGANTPLSPPAVMWDAQGKQPLSPPLRTPQHHSSTPPIPVYDEDTPLMQGGVPGVKRSRTLPSPGEKAASSVRLVSGRRGSDSRATPLSPSLESRLAPDNRLPTAPSPLRSPLPRGTSPLGISPAATSYLATTPDLEKDAIDSNDPSSSKKTAGWRKAFRKEKEREFFLQPPPSESFKGSSSASSQRSPEESLRGSTREDPASLRRPSSSSAAVGDASAGGIRAVRNPPFQGHGKEGAGAMSKRDNKKVTEQTFTQEAIRDAVNNIGR